MPATRALPVVAPGVLSAPELLRASPVHPQQKYKNDIQFNSLVTYKVKPVLREWQERKAEGTLTTGQPSQQTPLQETRLQGMHA